MAFGSERSVKVVLKASVSDYVGKLTAAQKATSDFTKDVTKSAGKNKAAWESTGRGFLVAGAAIEAGVLIAVKAFMDFDATMSQAQAGTMATGVALESLRTAAIKSGADTMFSATEAAQAITEMGKAGISTGDILSGGLTGALDLAAAGQLAVGKASEIAATAMNQFGLKGKDIPHIADLLAAGAGKALGSVEDLSESLKFAGVVAAGAGWSIDETTAVLAEFAQAGIKGEMAGTSLRGVMLSLQAPSSLASKTMEQLGINIYDAEGAMLKAAPLAQILKDKLDPLDTATRNLAMGQIFGNAQITAAQVLYRGGGAAVDEWTKKVNDAGFAARQAAILTDNLKGDVERLGGSLSSVLIQSGSGANDMLRAMTQHLQGAVDLYGSLPGTVQQGATALGVVAGAVSLVAGGLLVLAPRIVATRVALESMGRTGQILGKGITGVGVASKMLGGPLILATVALGYFAKQAQESKARVDEMADSLDQQTGAITENTRAWINKNLSDDGTLESARAMGVATGDMTLAVEGNADAIRRVDDALVAYGITLAGNADITTQIDAMDKLQAAYRGGNDELNEGIKKTKLLAETNAATIDPVTGLTGATNALVSSEEDLAKAADAAKKAHDDLKAAIEGFGNATLDARGAARDYQSALDGASKALKDNGKTLDTSTEKGRANQIALESVRTTALRSVVANFEHTGSVKALSTEVAGAREKFVTMAMQMGMSKIAAGKLATELGLTTANVTRLADEAKKIPKSIPVAVTLTGYAGAYQRLMNIQSAINGINNTHVRIATGAGGQGGITFAAGGPVTGPGTGTSDSIPAYLSNGEYIIKAAARAKYGTSFFDQLNHMRFAKGGVVGGSSTSTHTETNSNPIYIDKVSGPTIQDIEAQADRRRRMARLGAH